MIRTAPLLLTIIGLATAIAPTAAAPEDLDAMLDGVEEITAPGCVPGPVCAFTDSAFPVISARAGRNRLAMIAASRLGEGRVLVGGHEGLFSALGDRPDNLRFVSNAIRWVAGGEEAPKVALCGIGIADPLAAAGFGVTAIGAGEIAARLGEFDVLLANAGKLGDATDEARIQAVTGFIEEGGGLIAAQCPWGWEQVTGRQLNEDLGANVILAKAGLALADGMLSGTGEAGFLADRSGLELTSAARALAALEATAQGKDFGEAGYSQISATLASAVRALRRDDLTFLPRFRALCEGPEAECVPTPDAPVTQAQPVARIAATLWLHDNAGNAPEEMAPHPSADAYPGAVPDDAPRVEATVAVDTTVPDWHSTGLYAAPGEVVALTVPADAVGQGLQVRIGCHTDGIWHHDQWKRFPEISRTFAIDQPLTTVANPFGGLIYIVVPGGKDLGVLDVRIDGAVRAPYFVYGETSRSEWRETISKYPAPWAELATGKVILSVPSDAVRDLDDPEYLLAFWDYMMDCVADLAALPRERHRPERYVPDVQISAGYMHSGYPIMTHLDAVEPSLSRDHLVAEGSWGHFHEMGHNYQSGYWTFGGTGEVTCNLFSLYVTERACATGDPGHPAMDPVQVRERMEKHMAEGASFDRWKGDPFLALTMYVQLKNEFGWGAFTRVFAEYRDAPPGELPSNDDEKRNQWMVRLSKQVGRNLGPFFDAWGVPVSDTAKAEVAGLPDWLPEGLPLPE